jgi:hypothetical protein
VTSQFIKSLQEERSRLEPIANHPDLKDALERKLRAQKEHEENKLTHESYGGSRPPGSEELRLALQEANQAYADLLQPAERAQTRIKEIDRLLAGERNSPEARKDISRINSQLREARHTITQYSKIESDLLAEISELETRLSDARKGQGAEELKARLAGKSAKASGTVAAIEEELRSRRDALEATQTAKGDAQAVIDGKAEELSRAEARYTVAQRAIATVVLYDMIISMMPQLARGAALGSELCGGYGNDEFKIVIDGQSIDMAKRQLREEIAAA